MVNTQGERRASSVRMGVPQQREAQEEGGCCSWSRLRGSRKLVLLIVAVALLLDNMLLTSIVPIIPSFLYHLKHRPVGTVIIPEQPMSPASLPLDHRKLPIPLPASLPLDDENVPLLLTRLRSSGHREAETWEVPGFTIVPSDQFWQMTALAKRALLADRPLRPPGASSVVAVNASAAVARLPSRHQELVDENTEVGLMFASKPLVQAFANPFIGPLSNRVGYPIIMFVGFLTLFTTSIAFAIGNTYTTLFMARTLQGVGSSCTSVAGMGMLAEYYPDDAERGNAMSLALGGLALGVLVGPVFGGTLYQFVGKATPFLILAGLALLDGALQLLVLRPKVKRKVGADDTGPSLLTLLKDPYIMIAAGAITFSNVGIAVLEPSLPLWMMDRMGAAKWQQGVAFLPASISYLVGTNLFGPLGHRMGRWLAAMIGLMIIGICLVCVPLAKSVEELIPANAGIGFAIGMVDSSMMPLLGHLVDIRHTSVYGCVYAIADIAFCLGFIIGPVFSATIVQKFGFEGTVIAVALTSFCYAPLMLLLRNPPGKKEEKAAISPIFPLEADDEADEETALTPSSGQAVCY